MASANDTLTLVPGVVTQITQSSCTRIRIQSLSSAMVRFMAAANTTPPASFAGALHLEGQGDLVPASLTLSDLFPHVASPVHLFAVSDQRATISFSHD